METVTLPSGRTMPRLGLGTWRMGERAGEAAREVAAIARALDLGIGLIDTAEMYGEGGSETIIGRAIAGRRDSVFLVSKVYPHNASRAGVAQACARSLKRLGTDRLDLYLLHWPGQHPLAETVAGFEDLRRAGHIRDWGVSNFDSDDMAALGRVADGGACATNQVLYNLGRRGIEFDLLPALAARRIPVMAYTPLEPLKRKEPVLSQIATARGVSPAAVALAWVLRHPHMVAIPKAVDPTHIAENLAAEGLVLTAAELAALDGAYPAPKAKRPLEML